MSRYDAVTQLPGSPEAEQNLQAQAWQQMRDPAVIVDRQGVILASNDSFEALLPDRAPSSAQGLPRLAEAAAIEEAADAPQSLPLPGPLGQGRKSALRPVAGARAGIARAGR